MTVKEFYAKHDLRGYILDKIKFDTAENEILFLMSDDTDDHNRVVAFQNASAFTFSGGELPVEDEILHQQISPDGTLTFTFLENDCVVAVRCSDIEIRSPLNTVVFTSFYIESSGNFENINDYSCRYVPDENSVFDPDVITKILKLSPTHTRYGSYDEDHPRISSWEYRIPEPSLDAEEQLVQLSRKFSPLIPKINEIKSKYNVEVGLMIVPHIYSEEAPIIGLSRDVIEFCQKVGAVVTSDTYVYECE